MSARKALLFATLALLAAATAPGGASAAQLPAWKLRVESHPTNFVAGAKGRYLLFASNVGSALAAGPIVFTDNLPEGLAPLALPPGCSIVEAQTIRCEISGAIQPGSASSVEIGVQVGPLGESTTLKDEAEITGGGVSAKASTTTTVSSTPAPFDLLGFNAPTLDEEGGAFTTAGAHPFSQIFDLYFPTVEPGETLLTGSGHVRNITVDLPRGMFADPAVTPVLCTEAELITEASPGCPDASAVGTASASTSIGALVSESVPLYNMVPPPGAPAEFGLDILGIFVHVTGSLRSDSDYGLSGSVNDTLARSLNPIFGASVELWGDPSASVHNHVRGHCIVTGESCPVGAGETALLTTPSECSGKPLRFAVHADSWEEPSPSFPEREAEYESANFSGETKSQQGCDELAFEPTIRARPTTKLADSPAGLDFDLHQPQNTSLQEGKGRSEAALKDISIAFPPGLAVNASQAGGLGACTEQQIGYQPSQTGAIAFSKAPQSCPAAAKLGTLEVTSPLLVQRNPAHEVEVDPETGEPILEPLHGSIYIAKPFANPFSSLVGIYLAIEDEKTGIVAKLAGKGELDPTSGQITARFAENPELPLEDFRAHLFGGPRGALVTPPACGKYTTTANLTPWSAPEGKDAQAKDSFRVSSAPGGGGCPTTEAQLPNAPKLVAGTLSPQAGTYSPLTYKLSREDGSQRLGRIEATLPPGLSAKLAGVAQCPAGAIAKARSREVPNQGAAEQADPSCPAASELGTLTAAAGAGPTPYYTSGHLYLTGPYKGAPLSVLAIVPAVAGPFDLGAVVIRSALYIDPTTAQARALTDPLPQLLDGVPIDLRQVSLQLNRPDFTLNPTNCETLAFGGAATSPLGSVAPLFERFQVGGCKALPYKPKLSTRLFGPIHRGGHPRFRVVFTAKRGEANTKRIVLALPRSEFIDQAHFRTICTRVQFAAEECPAGSVYGHVKATTPLLDYPLEGPIYLRSSVHKLPDVVAALRGPPSQPLEFEAVGRVDSVNGGLRTTFQTIPDAPLTKVVATLQGAKKGLFQNSTNICKGAHRATLTLRGQNGKSHGTMPLMRADCKAGKKAKRGGHARP